MKTTINVQKTTFKTLAVVTGMAIFSLSANAQHLFKLTNENPVNFALAETKIAFNVNNSTRTFHAINIAHYAAYLVPETEESLEVEDWMTNEINFNAAKKTTLEAMVNLTPATEEPLGIESWMLNTGYFDGSDSQNDAGQVQKAGKVIKTDTYIFTEVGREKELIIEDWMINPKIWTK